MHSAAPVLDWLAFDAVLFDLDGVITPTAEIHERAWATLFARWDFTANDYLTYVDGKPRYDGVQSFLAARGVDLPGGDPTDPPGDDTVCAMGNRKNDVFNEVLDRDGVDAVPRLVGAARSARRARRRRRRSCRRRRTPARCSRRRA